MLSPSNSNNANVNTTSASSGSSGAGLGDFSKKILVVLLIILVVTIIIFSILMIVISASYPKTVPVSDKNEEVLLNFIHNCKNNPLDISTKAISASTSGNEYSLTFWVFINNLDDSFLGSQGHKNFDIITKGKIESNNIINTDDVNLSHVPINIYLEEKSSTLRVSMAKEEGTHDALAGKKGCYINTGLSPSGSFVGGLDRMDKNYDDIDTTDDTSNVCENTAKGRNDSYFGVVNNACYYIDQQNIDTLNQGLENNLIYRSQIDNIENCIVPSPSEAIYIDSIVREESIKPCRINNFPIQRWNCITLNVHNNVVDLFFDGKLLHTCVYDSNLLLNNDPIIIGNRGGFDGYVSNVIWSNKALHANEIYEKYSLGPRIRLTMNDRIKYMFMRKPKNTEASLDQIDYVKNQQNKGRV
jgi:hypothetical protein